MKRSYVIVLALVVAGMLAFVVPKAVTTDTQQASLFGATATATAPHLPPNWSPRLLALLGAPRTTQNLRLLKAWAISEGGTAQANPLNTTYTLPYGESWAYNGSLVQNYWRSTGGVAATALTLIQDTYACILGAFQVGTQTAEAIVSKCAAQFQTWGTSPSVIQHVLAETP